MSAIWGKISFTSTLTDDFAIMRKHYETKCRIDAYSEFTKEKVHMACGVQYITPEATYEHLPIKDEKVCFTADCVLDNRSELMSLLAISDTTIPDGTLMYEAYLKWGIDCLKHFRGTFSLAVYDYAQECLYLAADPVSSRCLYYYAAENSVVFSTLLKPIVKLCPHIGINEMYIKDYLAAPGLMPNLVPDETPYQNIYKINPGTYIKLTKTTRTETRYWNISENSNAYKCRNAEEYGALFYKLYSEAVTDTLRSSQNVGIAMSSGLDSASVGALAAQELQKSNQKLYTYTYVPYEKCESDRNKNNIHDETKDVYSIVETYPNMVPHFLCNEGKNSYNEIDDILDMLEIPFKAYVNFPNLREIYESGAKDSCRIMLSGQTGNASVSHGYINDVLFDLYYNKHYFTFLQYMNEHCKYTKVSRKLALKTVLRYFQHSKKVLRNEPIFTIDNPFLLKRNFENYPLKARFFSAKIFTAEQVPTSREKYFDFLYRPNMHTYIGEFETKLGLKYGMVLRDPTKDVRILHFCRHLPYKYFAYRGEPRWLIRGNFKKILPPQLLNNWNRYGVQNSDWYIRLQRDWETIESQMKQELSHTALAPYIDSEQITAYFSNTEKDKIPNPQFTLHSIVFLCILAKFFNSRQM